MPLPPGRDVRKPAWLLSPKCRSRCRENIPFLSMSGFPHRQYGADDEGRDSAACTEIHTAANIDTDCSGISLNTLSRAPFRLLRSYRPRENRIDEYFLTGCCFFTFYKTAPKSSLISSLAGAAPAEPLRDSCINSYQFHECPVPVIKIIPTHKTHFLPERVSGFIAGERHKRRFRDSFRF